MRSTLLWLLWLCLSGVSSLYAQSISTTIGGIKANPTDGDPRSQFWNPATIGLIEGTAFSTDLAIVGGYLSYDRNSGTDNSSQSLFSAAAPIPYLGIASNLGTRRFRFGYATYVPSGSFGSFDEDGAQRYDLITGLFLAWHHQLTAAIKVHPDFTFAGSGILSSGFFRTKLDIDLSGPFSSVLKNSAASKENPAYASRFDIPLSHTLAYGWALGMLYHPNEKFRFGLSYYSSIHYEFEQEVTVGMPNLVSALGPAPLALGLESTLNSQATITKDLPGFLQGGIQYKPFGFYGGNYFFRYTFSSLERFLTVHLQHSPVEIMNNLTVSGPKPEDSYFTGTSQSFYWKRWQFGGYGSYFKNGVPDEMVSIRTIEFDSITTGTFAGYRFGSGWSLSAEYAHSFFFDRRPLTSDGGASFSSNLLTPVSTTGHYQSGLDRFAIGASYAF